MCCCVFVLFCFVSLLVDVLVRCVLFVSFVCVLIVACVFGLFFCYCVCLLLVFVLWLLVVDCLLRSVDLMLLRVLFIVLWLLFSWLLLVKLFWVVGLCVVVLLVCCFLSLYF